MLPCSLLLILLYFGLQSIINFAKILFCPCTQFCHRKVIPHLLIAPGVPARVLVKKPWKEELNRDVYGESRKVSPAVSINQGHR